MHTHNRTNPPYRLQLRSADGEETVLDITRDTYLKLLGAWKHAELVRGEHVCFADFLHDTLSLFVDMNDTPDAIR
jgi:hypothetical protein